MGPFAPEYLDFVRQREGFYEKPYWDHKQASIGYGTRARPGETSITREEADRRLSDELGKARNLVRGFGAKLSPSQEYALTDLTYNAGNKWMSGGLGQAVRSGDWQRAADIFRQYNKASGRELPGLARRRNDMAPWLLNASDTLPQITAQSASPTSSAASPQARPGMIDSALSKLNGMFANTPSAQPPASAESMIASLEKMGISKDDPMYGSYVTLANALANTRQAEEWSPARKGLSGFADAMGTGLMARAGVNVPMHMADTLKQQSAERQKLEDRAYQAQLQLLGMTIPYKQKQAEQQKRLDMINQARKGFTGSAPVAPGGAGGVQMPGGPTAPGAPAARPPAGPAMAPGATAPIAPVQQSPLPFGNEPLAAAEGMAPSQIAPTPTPPQMPPQAPQAPQQGLPPIPGATPPTAVAPPAGAPATPVQATPPQSAPAAAPAGPAGPGSKFRITPEMVDRMFPLIPQEEIERVSLIDGKYGDDLKALNDQRLKQRDQFIKLYEVGRSTDDPQSVMEKETAKHDAKRAGDLATMKQKAGLAIQGIGAELQALMDYAGSGKMTSGAIGPWDASDEPIIGGPMGWIAPSGKTMGRILNSFDTAEWGAANPEQQRAIIEQSSMGILNVAKKLVREAGEGTFSEGDQQLLNKLVGELTQARNIDDFKERVGNLRNVMQRIFAEPFGLKLPTLNMGGSGDKKQAPGVDDQARNAEIARRYQAADPAGKAAIEQSLRQKGIDPATVLGGPQPTTPAPQGEPMGPPSPDDVGGQPAQQAAIQQQLQRLKALGMGAF